MRIIIGADLVPTKSNFNLFSSENVEKLFGEDLINDLSGADMRLFNLETPLITTENPIKKVGPHLGINVNVINGIKKINPSFLTLANNHIMDHGISGLNSTIKALNENNIQYGGVGKNIVEANKMWIKEINGKRIGIYSCVEHEFSVAKKNAPGANPFDYIESFKCIELNRNKCDFIIVLYHGGKEYYPYPTPKLQKNCRYFIDKGADFVICQHSHCIGCEEKYKNKTIVYGQGNFIFDNAKREEWNHGLLIELNINKKGSYFLRYIVLTKVDNCIRKANEDEHNRIINIYHDRSKEILSDEFVEDNYVKFAMSNIDIVLDKIDLFSNKTIVKILNKITNRKFLKLYLKKIYLKKMSYKVANAVECEAWNEMLQTIVDSFNK